jgi:hypothetical protein
VKGRPSVLATSLIAAAALAGPARLESQCETTGTPTVYTTFLPYVVVVKNLVTPAYCLRAAMVNASFCQPRTTTPAPGLFVTTLAATAHTGNTVSPFCEWICTCGSPANPGIRTDGGDGLPVELMDFEIEGWL